MEVQVDTYREPLEGLREAEMDNKIRVLVIDDEDDFRTVISTELADMGFSVFASASAEDARKKFAEEPIDVALLDITMPGMDGFQALPIIKHLSPGTEVIMLTASDNADSAVKAMKLGSYDYLTKPCQLDEIEVVINKAYENKKLRMQTAAPEMDAHRELPEPLDKIMSLNLPADESGHVQKATVGVSLSHDDRACFCVAGQGAQGCDIAPVTPRTEQEWRKLLYGFQGSLMSELLSHGESIDLAGTRVWAAMEALRKATDTMDVEFTIDRREEDSVLFRPTDLTSSYSATRDLYVLTFPMALTRGPERVVAVVGQVEKSVTSEPKTLIETGGMTDDHVYVYRFKPAFKSYSNLGRTFYFTNYFALMEKLRGIGLGDAFHEQITKQFATGEWAVVTNHSEARIFDTPRGIDGNPIEVHLWLGDISGPTNSTAELKFDWYQIRPDGRRERIAVSEQHLTWVKILGHGVAKTDTPPDHVMKAMKEALLPGTPPLPCPLPEELPEIDFGSELYSEPPGPSGRPSLQEETLQTSLEDADIVGNINFSDYFVWQGRVRNSYFHKLAPGYYRGAGGQGELLCRRSRVEHLREAMPFDRVYIRMSLQALYECGVSLYFEYFRLDENGKKDKLAFGEHDAVWAKCLDGEKFVSAPLPSEIKEALLSVIPDRRPGLEHPDSSMAAGG